MKKIGPGGKKSLNTPLLAKCQIYMKEHNKIWRLNILSLPFDEMDSVTNSGKKLIILITLCPSHKICQ